MKITNLALLDVSKINSGLLNLELNKMSGFKYKCGVCLQPKEVLQNLLKADSTKESWTSKLQLIVPEVEWPNTLKICTDCAQKTDQACEFRRMCIKMDEERRRITFSCQKDDKAGSNYQSEKELRRFSCSKCEQSFQTQQCLFDHICIIKLDGTLQEIPANCRDNDDDNSYYKAEEQKIQNCSEAEESFENQQPLNDPILSCVIEMDEEHQQIPSGGQDSDSDGDNYQSDNEEKPLRDCSKRDESSEDQHHLDDSPTSPRQDQQYRCFHCNKHFRCKTLLTKHIQNKHKRDSDLPVSQKDKKYTCDKCDKEYIFQKPFTKHLNNCYAVKAGMNDDDSTQQYECFHCSANFRMKATLIKHIRDKHKQASDLYTCSDCNKRHHSEDALTEHISQCEGIKLHPETQKVGVECDKCHKIYSTHNVMKIHRKHCTGEACEKGRKSKFDLFCEVCNEKQDYVRTMIEHCVKIHAMDPKLVKPYGCLDCPMRFQSSTDLLEHKKYHSGVRTHVCSYCGKSFITRKDLRVHELIHLNRRDYKCKTCGKTFNTRHNLRGHNWVVHTDRSQWKYLCSSCGQRFPYKTMYDVHMRRHTGDKRFSCHICSKQFMTATDIKSHLPTHSTAKPFKCDLCDKGFKRKHVLKIHMADAHNIGHVKVPERVDCLVCGRTLPTKTRLKEHMAVHTGIRPYECKLCGKKLTRQYYLNKHLKSAHSDVPPAPTMERDLKDEGVDIKYNIISYKLE